MTTMALDRFDSNVTRRSRRAYQATPVRASSRTVRTPLIDVREMDDKSFRLASLLVRPAVLAVMFTAAWQIGLLVGQIRL